MTGFLLFCAFLVLVGVGLIAADSVNSHGRRQRHDLTTRNRELLSLVHAVEVELAAQLTTGCLEVEYALQLIKDSGFNAGSTAPNKKGSR